MWEYDEKRGGWLKDGTPTEQIPPMGAAFWTKDESGNWQMGTVNEETPGVKNPNSPPRTGNYGNDDQSREGRGNQADVDYAPGMDPVFGSQRPSSGNARAAAGIIAPSEAPMGDQEMRDRMEQARNRGGLNPVAMPQGPATPAGLPGNPGTPGVTPGQFEPKTASQQQWELRDGKWLVDGLPSPTPPPNGTPFWQRDAGGSWQMTTMNPELDTTKPIETPGTNAPPAGNPSPVNPPLVDGRISKERIAGQDAPPPGVSDSAWADIKAGNYAPPTNSGSPGGPTDELKNLLYPAKPETTKPEPTFRMPSTFEGRFFANEDGTMGGGRADVNYGNGLLASIQQMIDGGSPQEKERAQFIMSGLSSGRKPQIGRVSKTGPANLIDQFGAEWDTQNNPTQRRQPSPDSTPKEAVPVEDPSAEPAMAEDNKGKRGGYVRRYAPGTMAGRYAPRMQKRPPMTMPSQSFPMPSQRAPFMPNPQLPPMTPASYPMPIPGGRMPVGSVPGQIPMNPGGTQSPPWAGPQPMAQPPVGEPHVYDGPFYRGNYVPAPQPRPMGYQRRFSRGTIGGAGLPPATFR